MISLNPGPLYYWMAKTYSENKTPENKVTILNEGGFRSGKTWDTASLIYTFCDHNRFNKMPLEIGIFRNTLQKCREITYEMDFKKCAQTYGIYDECTVLRENQAPEMYLWGNRISFLGLDNKTERPSYDIVFINEILDDINWDMIRGLYGRCNMLFIGDWNPKYTHHWIFDWEGRPNVFFSHTTYKNNKFLYKAIVSFIESTSPWHLDDLHLPENERRPHEENIKNKTVDKWYFLVYGMGKRASHEGLVFPNVTYIDKFPDDCEQISYGLDFGETAESAFVKTGIKKRGKIVDLFIQNLFYKPTQTSDEIIELIRELEKQGLYVADTPIWCDNNQDDQNAGIGWVHDMREAGLQAFCTNKFPGSRAYWISTIKRFNINIIKDERGVVQMEQENFCYEVVDGITLSRTIKKFDHNWSATGYSVVGDFTWIFNE